MATTLLWILARVREGKIKAFAFSGIMERPDGSSATFGGSSADGDRGYEVELLGAMRLEEHALIERRRARENHRFPED